VPGFFTLVVFEPLREHTPHPSEPPDGVKKGISPLERGVLLILKSSLRQDTTSPLERGNA